MPMMDKATSELLIRTGPNTPMGKLMRRYWVPVMSSSEIAEADGPQVRIQIMGEKLLAFRDTEGRPGLISEFCSHRGVSLFLGRNEEGGIRCSYHGLKFDITGKCLEVPSAPHMCPKMGIAGYPCIERGGLVWAYLGPADKQPEPPEIEWALVPESNRFITKRLQQCNYLQAMEGGIDTAHVSFVHRYEVDIDPMHRGTKAIDYIKADGNVTFEIEQHDGGLIMYGKRKGEIDSNYWRITQWLFPWYTFIPPFGEHALGAHVWVPIDDENCWAWSINFHPNKPLSHEELDAMKSGKGIHVKYEEGSFRPAANKDNDYLIDRVAQKERRSYSGVFGFSEQDASLQESMGPIQNHEAERILPTDKGISMARRMLIEGVKSVQNGTEPPALKAASHRVRAAGVLLPLEDSPMEWAKDHLADALKKPVYSL
jgi:phthalate 4,5-dioxygenase